MNEVIRKWNVINAKNAAKKEAEAHIEQKKKRKN